MIWGFAALSLPMASLRLHRFQTFITREHERALSTTIPGGSLTTSPLRHPGEPRPSPGSRNSQTGVEFCRPRWTNGFRLLRQKAGSAAVVLWDIGGLPTPRSSINLLAAAPASSGSALACARNYSAGTKWPQGRGALKQSALPLHIRRNDPKLLREFVPGS